MIPVKWREYVEWTTQLNLRARPDYKMFRGNTASSQTLCQDRWMPATYHAHTHEPHVSVVMLTTESAFWWNIILPASSVKRPIRTVNTSAWHSYLQSRHRLQTCIPVSILPVHGEALYYSLMFCMQKFL